jgi:hypothetical protein
MKTAHILSAALLISLFCSSQLFAKETPLTVGETNSFLADRTMTLTKMERDKKTGKNITFRAFFGKLGAVRAIYPDGASTNYNWSVDSNSRLCFIRRSGTCGFLTMDDNGSYKFYKSKKGADKTVVKDGRPVKNSYWKHVIDFSDIQDGEHL